MSMRSRQKKSQELAGFVEELRGVFEFPGGGDLPIRAYSTRWITHKRRALQRILDRYGAYVHHRGQRQEKGQGQGW